MNIENDEESPKAIRQRKNDDDYLYSSDGLTRLYRIFLYTDGYKLYYGTTNTLEEIGGIENEYNIKFNRWSVIDMDTQKRIQSTKSCTIL